MEIYSLRAKKNESIIKLMRELIEKIEIIWEIIDTEAPPLDIRFIFELC